MPDKDTDPVLQKLPPEKLLAADRLRPIRAGIRCMDSIETIQEYVAYESQHRDRTQVQAALRIRARELRDAEPDDDAEANPVL
jgi:predicted hydrolase (HD superfamily)